MQFTPTPKISIQALVVSMFQLQKKWIVVRSLLKYHLPKSTLPHHFYKVQSICCCKSRHTDLKLVDQVGEENNGGNSDQDGIGDVAMEHTEDEF